MIFSIASIINIIVTVISIIAVIYIPSGQSISAILVHLKFVLVIFIALTIIQKVRNLSNNFQLIIQTHNFLKPLSLSKQNKDVFGYSINLS